MKDEDKTKKQLINELKELQKLIAELEASKTDSNCPEEVLGNRNNRYKTLIENLPQKIFYKDKNSVYVSCNNNYARDLKVNPDEITGKTDCDFHPIELAEKYRADDKRIMESGNTETIEETYVQDGKEVVVNTVKTPVKNDKGNIVGILGIFWDITERKKNEKEIKETRDFLENIYKTSADGIMITDQHGCITMVNEATEKMLGYSKDELIGKHTGELSLKGKNHEEQTKEFLSELFGKGIIAGFEHSWLRKDGSLIDFETSIALLKDEEGNVIGAVGGIRDITERKRAEETLRKSEEKYQSLIEHANDAILSVNREGMIIGFNKKAEEMFGYSREEMLGKPSYLLVVQQHREKQKRILKQFAETGTGLSMENKINAGKGIRKDGKEFDVEFSYHILDIHGELIATSIVRDISERKEAEKKVLEYQKRLKSLTSQMTLNEEKERKHLADYLHDQIGQELFATKMKLDLLKDSLSSNEDVKNLSDLSNSLIRTIENTRSLTFELSPPILYQFGLEAALEWLAEHTYVQYNIVVSFEDDKQEKPLDDDVKIFLYQAVRELLTNVAKHAQVKNARVSVKKDNSNIRICVEDGGVGFTHPHKGLSKVGKKSYGLFSIEERLDYLGGYFEITSRDGRGTQARLTAPLKVKKES